MQKVEIGLSFQLRWAKQLKDLFLESSKLKKKVSVESWSETRFLYVNTEQHFDANENSFRSRRMC